MIDKLRNVKLCLSKNVLDLQTRLKMTREELGYLQKQVS